MAIYEELRDLIGYLHFKGGQAGADGKLAWASSLAEASWPVADIVRRAVADGTVLFLSQSLTRTTQARL